MNFSCFLLTSSFLLKPKQLLMNRRCLVYGRPEMILTRWAIFLCLLMPQTSKLSGSAGLMFRTSSFSSSFLNVNTVSPCSIVGYFTTFSQRTTASGGTWFKPNWRRSLDPPLKLKWTGCFMWEGELGGASTCNQPVSTDLTCCFVVSGVLQQPRGDVVPQGNNTVLTQRACPPTVKRHSIKSSAVCPVGGQSLNEGQSQCAGRALRASDWRTKMSAVQSQN